MTAESPLLARRMVPECENVQPRDGLVPLETRRPDGAGAPPRPRATLTGSPRAAPAPGGSATAPPARPNRRGMLRAVVGVAAATVGAGVLVAKPQQAAADDGDPVTAGNETTAQSATVVQFNGSNNPGVVFLVNDSGYSPSAASYPAAMAGFAQNGHVTNGVYGYTEIVNGNGVVGHTGDAGATGAGVLGLANSSSAVGISGSNGLGTGVSGSSDSTADNATAIVGTITSTAPGGFSAAVRGVNNGTGGNGIGVYGSQVGAGWGVYGTSASGVGGFFSGGSGTGVSAFGGSTGVSAISSSGIGVAASGGTTGVSASSFSGTGVSASSTSGTAVSGVSTNGTGVLGQSNGAGDGIVGYSNTGNGFHGHSQSGHGVYATSLGSGCGIRATSTSGYGAELSGGLAPLRLDPVSSAGAPSSGGHHMGELFVDKNGVLYFCIASGTPGTWKTVTLS